MGSTAVLLEAVEKHVPFADMDDGAYAQVVRHIIETSRSREEIIGRLAAIGAPEPALTVEMPTDDAAGRELQAIRKALGAPSTAIGAMVMIMSWTPSGGMLQL